MEKLPQKVADTYSEIRKRYKFFVALKKIYGNFYLYKQSTRWDRESKKVKTVSNYLGKINSDGAFVEKTVQPQGEPAKAAVSTTVAGANAEQMPEPKLAVLDETDLKLLTILSMNARADLASWAKRLGLSASTLYARKRALEHRFGIRYTLEVDVGKLGFLEYIAYVKFIAEKPSMDVLKQSLSGEPHVQLAALTSGEYDMFVYFLADDNRDVANIIENIISNTDLKEYASKWSVTPFFSVYGFVPLTANFFTILKSKIWLKSRDNPRPRRGELLTSEYVVLKELNASGTIGFAEIDAKHSLPRGSAQYTFHRLVERGTIRRVSMTMDALTVRYNIIFIVEIISGGQFSSTKAALLGNIISYGAVANRYALVGDTEGAFGVMLVMPVLSEGGAQVAEEDIVSKVRGINIRRLVVTDTMLGSFCYRRFDNTHSYQHKHLVEDFKTLEPVERIEY